ncbi:MAG: SUMF1/EgtB/PvdO family nonheme iron enzyme [Planctomycetota bacterium]
MKTIRFRRTSVQSASVCTIAIAACPVMAAPVSYEDIAAGFDLVTIGDPGNRAPLPEETPDLTLIFPDSPQTRGSVNYEYRIGRTEITVAQHLEFVQAYYPFYDDPDGGVIANSEFTGRHISASFAGLGIRQGVDPNIATNIGWEYAARYVNWLHNGKVNEAWAFETGVYDTSTFTRNPDGTFNHQVTPAEGARFWIPTHDEWIKAAHYDPNRYGEGQGGYWTFPNATNEDLLPGHPDDGGQRNAFDEPDDVLPVGSYPDQQSPWGLLDLAGGETEWMSTLTKNSRNFVVEGSNDEEFGFLFSFDKLDFSFIGGTNSKHGFRIASIVPAPSAALVAGVWLALSCHRRERCWHSILGP